MRLQPTNGLCVDADVQHGACVAAALPIQAIVDKAYCLPREQVFFLEESVMSISGDDFNIKDAR